MSISGGSSKDNFNEINITPLTDIFLVLLIIMMVIAPSFQNIDQNIEIPEINSGLEVGQKQVEVSITKDGKLYVNKSPSSSEQLVEDLKVLLDNAEEKALTVRADKETKNKDVLSVMRAAQAAGYEKLTIAGEPLSRKSQRQLESATQESHSSTEVEE